MRPKRVYLSLGSNLGKREENLQRALAALELKQIQIVARSSLYETEPQNLTQQRWFLNLVIECETRYFPMQLLGVIQKIERELGRERGAGSVRWGPRPIDIDVLLFGNVIMEMPQLTIPHPRMLERRFVLEPLLEIAPDLRHPVNRESLRKFIGKVSGQKLRRVDQVSC
ncbi:MAG: 2-amino-4-hydroxy-6-hydroxymethyldihydropteridine diphosphokinase [Acidobacteriaceae bacterium]|nr:2-amino-4-hydroxy-6-hydroxymethyldihydropteridine diphosphokinase [Acidobacteriaceae bacterium]MBV9779022.1 2-amino-4-hydroxy-6-hydroxymethyldihydropteridine diphosphokinase [Acidobacteriaceae bacterium]